jgi:hypothetical protein
MTRHWSPLLCSFVAAMIYCSCARAGVWGVDPVLGIDGDYSTNPALLDSPHTAETHGALLLDAPATYNGDAFKLSLIPSFRLSNSSGYSSVASDYEHMNAKAEFDTERDVLTGAAGFNRDSSLYQNYLTDGSTGVRRDTLLADLNWDRTLTERVDFDTDINSTQVRYGQAAGIATLTDYQYTSVSPTVSWNSSERNKLTVAASVARYNSLDGTTESRSANLQAGFVRRLTEIWSLTSTAGYSRALNQLRLDEEFLIFTANGPAIETIPVKVESTQNGTVYSVNLSRKGTLLSIDATASRSLVPTGFAFLSRQESVELTANYTHSDRWSFTADAHYVKSQDPQLQGGIIERNPKYGSVAANWRWTEHWTATLSLLRVVERFAPPNVNVSSNELAITLSRRFNHIDFQ